jgi:hypothetical protein
LPDKEVSMRGIPWKSVSLVLSLCSSVACGVETGAGRVSLGLRDGSQPIGDSTGATATSDGAIFHGMVTLEQISLQPTDAGDEADRVVLYDHRVNVDLMTLNAVTNSLVDGAIVPVGHYSELSFVISGGFIDIGGLGVFASPDYPFVPAGTLVAGELKMPSVGSSGLEVSLPDGGLALVSDAERVVQVDFDVSRSFGLDAGTSGAWVMHPVINATDVTFAAVRDPAP